MYSAIIRDINHRVGKIDYILLHIATIRQNDKDLARNRLSNERERQTVYSIKQFISEGLLIWAKNND